jgi:hypothetical protein
VPCVGVDVPHASALTGCAPRYCRHTRLIQRAKAAVVCRPTSGVTGALLRCCSSHDPP